MKLGEIKDLSREDLESLCEQLHLAGELGSDAWAKSEHALYVLVEQGIVTREQVFFARQIGEKNFEAGMNLFSYQKMYEGPARPLTEHERTFVELL